jgi:hypothetical protein
MPCHGGYRQKIDDALLRARAEREKEQNDPFRKLWLSLVDRVDSTPQGFSGLTEEEKLYFAVSLLDGEVRNGGFDQYFFNHSGSYYQYAEQGLIALDANHILQLLRSAKETVFPAIEVPVDTATRRKLLREQREHVASKLDDLDRIYYRDPDLLESRLQSFVREKALIK